jgi:hypothetical protein
MCIGLHIKCSLIEVSNVNHKLEWVKNIKFPNIKFHENLLSSSQAVSYIKTDGQTAILIGAPQG